MSDQLVDQIADAVRPYVASMECSPTCGDCDSMSYSVALVALGVVRDAVKALDLPWCGHCGSTQAVLALLDGGAS